MSINEATFKKLKDGDQEAQVALWEMVRRFSEGWWSALGDEVHDVAAEVFTRLYESIRNCTVQWQGEPQFAALVRKSVANRVKDWLRKHPVAPSPAGPNLAGQPQAPTAGLGPRPADPLTSLLRQRWQENLDERLVEPLIELIVAMETKPSPQERLVLRGDLWVSVHEDLKPHKRTEAVARLTCIPAAWAYKPRSQGKRKVWEALQSEQSKALFKALLGRPPNKDEENDSQ
ncbi:MAG: RNA polymerase sigma factor [Bryobacteraceae bacterium]